MLVKRVLIVDEQPLFRLGMREALAASINLRIVGEVGNVHQALRATSHYRPHLVVVSDSLPGISGITLVETLAGRDPQCLAVLVVESLTDEGLISARNVGAVAVIERSILAADIPLALTRALHAGRAGGPEAQLRASAAGANSPRPVRTMASRPQIYDAAPALLSLKELEVLDCVVHGLSNKEIASELYVTEQTVKNHMTSVFRKMEVEDRVQALLFAVRHGWVTFGQLRATGSTDRRSA